MTHHPPKLQLIHTYRAVMASELSTKNLQVMRERWESWIFMAEQVQIEEGNDRGIEERLEVAKKALEEIK